MSTTEAAGHERRTAGRPGRARADASRGEKVPDGAAGVVLGILSFFSVVTLASLPVLVLAIVAAGAVFVTFVFTTLIHEPASIVTLAGIVVLSVVLDYGWKRIHTGTPSQVQVGGVGH